MNINDYGNILCISLNEYYLYANIYDLCMNSVLVLGIYNFGRNLSSYLIHRGDLVTTLGVCSTSYQYGTNIHILAEYPQFNRKYVVNVSNPPNPPGLEAKLVQYISIKQIWQVNWPFPVTIEHNG